MGTLLPPGFRFHPTDVELVMYYLKRKVMGKKLLFEAIAELNIYKFSPGDLPDKSCLKSKDLEWYFFCPRERKYASGVRMNRATETGYWKTTGKDRPVHYNSNVVGMVRTLVFHQGSAPQGRRTDWVIHEYRIEDKSLADKDVAQDAYVLCKVFQKNGPGPKNGAQYGAPFKEEDWDDDWRIPVDSLSPDGPFPPVVGLQQNKNSSAALSIVDRGHSSGLSPSEPGPSVLRPSMDEVLLDGKNSSIVTSMVDPANISGWSSSKAGASLASHSAHDMILDAQNDDIAHLLASFEDDPLPLTWNANNEVHLDQEKETQAVPNSDGNDPFGGLEDLYNLGDLNGAGHNSSDMAFLELDDLNVPLNFSAKACGTGEIQSNGLYGPCNFGGSQDVLPESLCAYNHSYCDLRQFENPGDFPGYEPRLTESLHVPSVLDSFNIQGNSVVTPMGHICHPTHSAYSLNLTAYEPEEFRNCREAGKRSAAMKIFLKTPTLVGVV